MTDKISPIKQIAIPMPEADAAEIKFLDENASWLRRSMHLAVEIRRQLRKRNMTQSRFAELMGVTPAQVTKILSGRENLGLKTICRIEDALGCELISISGENSRHCIAVTPVPAVDMVSEPGCQYTIKVDS